MESQLSLIALFTCLICSQFNMLAKVNCALQMHHARAPSFGGDVKLSHFPCLKWLKVMAVNESAKLTGERDLLIAAKAPLNCRVCNEVATSVHHVCLKSQIDVTGLLRVASHIWQNKQIRQIRTLNVKKVFRTLFRNLLLKFILQYHWIWDSKLTLFDWFWTTHNS